MEPSNATITLERIEGERVTLIWSERIKLTYGSRPYIRVDPYGTHWFYWDGHRLGLGVPDNELSGFRLMLTAD